MNCWFDEKGVILVNSDDKGERERERGISVKSRDNSEEGLSTHLFTSSSRPSKMAVLTKSSLSRQVRERLLMIEGAHQ
jgi:hypothetical protein